MSAQPNRASLRLLVQKVNLAERALGYTTTLKEQGYPPPFNKRLAEMYRELDAILDDGARGAE